MLPPEVTMARCRMSRKQISQVDQKTGEILGGFVAYVAPKRRNGFQHEGWFAMTQAAGPMETLANAELGDEARRVFFMLVAHLEHENFILTPQAEMAEKLKMARGHFSRALMKLEAEGVILRGPKIGRMVSFKLNPEYGWKGTAKNHVAALGQVRKDRMKAARIDGVIQGGKQPEDMSEVDTSTGDLFKP